jgi:hypothetical protein
VVYLEGEIDVERTLDYIARLKRMSEREALYWYWKSYRKKAEEGMQKVRVLYGRTLDEALSKLGY